MPGNLLPGMPLPDGEVWLRELTNRDYLKRDGTVHRQALKSPAISAADEKSWSHELSGRALSQAGDVASHGQASAQRARDKFASKGLAVPSKIDFIGVAFSRSEELRSEHPLHTDTVFTPNDDPAHADFVVYNSNDEDIDAIIGFLQSKLKTASVNDLPLALKKA